MSANPAMTEFVAHAPEPGAPACRHEVELILPSPDDAEAAAMARRGVLICRAGQSIARRVEIPSEASYDPQHALLGELRLGQCVVWDARLASYVACKAGHAWLCDGKLEIQDTLELHEDIDGATGPVTYDGQLIVRRNVLDMAVLKATGSITVQGFVEAAEVHTGDDLHIHHGICGKEKGHITAQGRVAARFITNARVACGGDMVIAREVVNSHLTCGGMLKVEQGTILSGHVIALAGILCHTAGSDAGAKTILEVGLAAERYTAIEQAVTTAELSLKKVNEIRLAVEPLMARAKTLTAAQKEKATELLYAADEAEAQARDAMTVMEHAKTALQTCMGSRISVSGMLHPGVIIRYPIATGLVTVPRRGPLEIVLCSKGGETRILVIDRCRNTSTPLQSLPNLGATADIAQRILGGPASAP